MKSTIIAAFLFLFIACREADTDREGSKIIKLSKEWSNTAATKDLEKTVGYWADDAVLMAPNQPILKGKQAIKQMVADSYKIPGFQISWEHQSVFVSKSGDLAYMIEKSTISFTDSTLAASIIFCRFPTVYLVPILWKGYNDRKKQYQGEIADKFYVQEKFRTKLQNRDSTQMDDIKSILKEIFTAFQG